MSIATVSTITFSYCENGIFISHVRKRIQLWLLFHSSVPISYPEFWFQMFRSRWWFWKNGQNNESQHHFFRLLAEIIWPGLIPNQTSWGKQCSRITRQISLALVDSLEYNLYKYSTRIKSSIYKIVSLPVQFCLSSSFPRSISLTVCMCVIQVADRGCVRGFFVLLACYLISI